MSVLCEECCLGMLETFQLKRLLLFAAKRKKLFDRVIFSRIQLNSAKRRPFQTNAALD